MAEHGSIIFMKYINKYIYDPLDMVQGKISNWHITWELKNDLIFNWLCFLAVEHIDEKTLEAKWGRKEYLETK